MIADCHVHFGCATRADELFAYLGKVPAERAGLLSLPDPVRIHFNPEVLYGAALLADRSVAFGSFDYADRYSRGAIERIDLESQVEELYRAGFAGIKLWEGKPTFQARICQTIDSPEMDRALDRAARNSMPVLLHVADPPVFWSQPDGSKFGWTAGDRALPSFEELMSQTERLLASHADGTIIFPHLLFLAGDLDRLSSLLDRFPGVLLDLSPGLYFYGDLHRTRAQSVEFFDSYRERILFGTDAMWFPPQLDGLPSGSKSENLARAVRLLEFLSGEEWIPNPFPYTREEIPAVQGLGLGKRTLEHILFRNYERVTAATRQRAWSATGELRGAQEYVERFRLRLALLDEYRQDVERGAAHSDDASLRVVRDWTNGGMK